MKQYDTYKDSGIEWIGQIPKHWIRYRLKDIGNLYSGLSSKSGDDFRQDDHEHNKGFIPFANIAVNTYIAEDNIGQVVIEPTERQNKVRKGDVFFLMSSEGYEDIGKTSLLDKDLGETYLNSFCKGYRLKSDRYNPHFINYLLLSDSYRYLLIVEGKGFTRINLKMEKVNDFFIHIPPPKQEQTAIAQYLDSKTQAIDKKISLLEKKMIYYKELRKSLINDAVTKGLDKNVELKDSGIDWIGQIPKHWEVKRLKDVFYLQTGNSISDKKEFEEKNDSTQFYVSTKDIDFDTGKINYDNGVYVPKGNNLFKRAEINSTLLCIEGANAGKKIGFTTKEICFVNKLCSVKGNSKNTDDKYFYYFFHTNAFGIQFFSLISGLIGGVSINQLKFLNTISPTKQEQTTIAQYLDEKTSTIDAIVNNIGQQIKKLKELRKTLINDVVTGKIKVTV